MPRSNRLRWLYAVAGLAALLSCLQCARSVNPGFDTAYVPAIDESAPGSSTTRPGQPDGPTDEASQQAEDARLAPAVGDANTVQPAAPQDTTANPVARLMRTTDAHDRALLSEVERETGKSPSSAIVELVQRRHAGAAQAELQQLIETQLAGDLRERMAAQRWLRAVFPGDSPAPTSSPSPGAGGGEPHLAPIVRKPR